MSNPEACVLKTDGINCDEEMAYAFTQSGANASIVHVNELKTGAKRLSDYSILAIPGGFSYGDDIASGRVLANELRSFMSDQIEQFREDQKPILGVCNGFQVEVLTGLLPFGNLGTQDFTLTRNSSGMFVCDWVNLKVEESVSRFVQPEDFDDMPIPMQVAHGEGRFTGSIVNLERLADSGLIVFRYAKEDGSPAFGSHPDNPNGSSLDIAGVCDPSGLILGLMPHPERSVAGFHADRSRTESARNAASVIFGNIVNYAREL